MTKKNIFKKIKSGKIVYKANSSPLAIFSNHFRSNILEAYMNKPL